MPVPAGVEGGVPDGEPSSSTHLDRPSESPHVLSWAKNMTWVPSPGIPNSSYGAEATVSVAEKGLGLSPVPPPYLTQYDSDHI